MPACSTPKNAGKKTKLKKERRWRANNYRLITKHKREAGNPAIPLSNGGNEFLILPKNYYSITIFWKVEPLSVWMLNR